MDSEHSREWKKAVELELECIKSNELAVLTPISDVPSNKRVLGTKWVFRVKANNRFKARFVTPCV